MTGIGDLPPTDVAHRIAQRALDQGILAETEYSELISCFSSLPTLDGCGLDPLDGQRFIRTNLQLIELCLKEPTAPRKGFVNPLLKRELEKQRQISGGKRWDLGKVSETGRRGSDRRFTFGQVKENPDDPDDPSFFCGVWLADV